MWSVEVRICKDDFSEAMDHMRLWLDHNKTGLKSFRYVREEGDTVVVVLTFADDVEADAFAKVFNGNLR